jgi:hypothetical protein
MSAGDSTAPDRLLEIVAEAVSGIDACVQALASSFPLPARTVVNETLVFRHQRKDDLLLSYLKLVKIASHHNAALVLILAGYPQEVYALCRMIDEACEDIGFMATPLDNGKPSSHQLRFIAEFYQEEFSGADFVESQQERDRVPRKKVRAGGSRIGGEIEGLDPAAHLKNVGALAGTFSGFVHGAYVHLMELFGGNPPRFHTRGMLGTPRMQECLGNHVNHLYRSLLAVELVGQRTYREDIVYGALDLSTALARQTKCVDADGVRLLVERRKRPLVKPS